MRAFVGALALLLVSSITSAQSRPTASWEVSIRSGTAGSGRPDVHTERPGGEAALRFRVGATRWECEVSAVRVSRNGWQTRMLTCRYTGTDAVVSNGIACDAADHRENYMQLMLDDGASHGSVAMRCEMP